MKTIEYCKKLNYKMVFHYDPEDKIHIVRFPELPGCIAHGKSQEEALKSANKVKNTWIESALNDGWTIPEPSLPLETTGRVTLRIPKSIHQKIIDRTEEEDVSQNQLILTYITEGLERNSFKDSIQKIMADQVNIIGSLNKLQIFASSITFIDPTKPYYIPAISNEASKIMANAVDPQNSWRWHFDMLREPEDYAMNRPAYCGPSRTTSANRESNARDDLKQKENSAVNDSNVFSIAKNKMAVNA